MSGVLTKDDENPVCHPEFISGSQTVQGQEILKRVQNDMDDDIKAVSSDERLLIIGLGNPLMGDDGAGIQVVNELQKLALPENIDVIDGGTPGVGLIDMMSGYSRVIVVDAVVGACHPELVSGSLEKVILKQVRDDIGDDNCSLHEMELTSVLRLMRTLGMEIPEITIVGIPAVNIAPGIGLSEECRGLIPQAVNLIKEAVR